MLKILKKKPICHVITNFSNQITERTKQFAEKFWYNDFCPIQFVKGSAL